jgi:deoxyhypusine monooxygenase
MKIKLLLLMFAGEKTHKVLDNGDENPMVRHEAAEALGAIASPESNDILTKYLKDPADVVRESCEIALDISEYYSNTEEFQYANALQS